METAAIDTTRPTDPGVTRMREARAFLDAHKICQTCGTQPSTVCRGKRALCTICSGKRELRSTRPMPKTGPITNDAADRERAAAARARLELERLT